MKKKGKGILLLLLLCVFLTAQAFAAETVVEVKRIAPTSSESGYMLLTLDENQVDKLFTFPHTYFLPGDTAEGTFCFRLEAGLKPVALKLTAMNTGGAENQAIFNAVKLQIFNGTVNVYNGNLSELQNTEIAAFSNPEKTSADKKVYLKLSLDKTAAKEMQSQSLQFSLSVTALMTDYNVILPENHVSGTVKVYQSLYNHKYYYPVSGTPTLESQEVAKGQTEIYLPDFEYIPGTTIGDADDYYIDHTDSSLRVYVGADLTVGTPDDAKDLKDGTNVRRGTSATASEQFGGTGHAGGDHYYNGSDGIPGTEDDKIIYAGDDGAYGTCDDYYVDTDGLKVYSGYDFDNKKQDLIFGNANDAKALKKSTGEVNGTNVLRGTSAAASEQFGGTGHAGGDHYYNGSDGIPGTEDDKKINAGDDGAYATGDDYYVDEDGLKVYSGYDFDNKKQDLIFGNANDAKALKKSTGEVNGTNVLRGTSAAPAEQFGGTAHAGGDHYYNGSDGIPGTEDDKKINAGTDGAYATGDDYYVDTDGLKVYSGYDFDNKKQDLIFGNANDAKALKKSSGEVNGTNVLRGTSVEAEEQFGGTAHAGGDHYYNGQDKIPGTEDDKKINAGTDGAYATGDDYYVDTDGLKVYSGYDFDNDKQDLIFGNANDAKALKKSTGEVNGTNVLRGASAAPEEQFGGTAHAGGDHYYNGLNGIPGTEDDKKINAGDDGAYGTGDDYYVDTDGLKVYSGYDFDNKKQDLIFGNANDAKALKKSSGEVNGTNVLRGASAAPAEQFGGTAHAGGTHYTNGPDKVPGTADDELIHAGDDPVSGVYYIDKTDNKKVYIGTDMCFGTADDAKDLEDGTNVCRGPEGAPAVQFGGAGYAGGGHFFNGADGTPGTADDKIIYTGTDGSFRTKDDYYIGDDGLEVYSGDDCIFGNSTDAKALEKSAGVKNGTCVLRGSNAAEFSGDHYYIGDDKIPGTADDRLISKGTDGVYGSKDDCYTDEQEGREVFSGKDLRFGTADDAMKIAENASNVRRGDSAVRAEQFGGAGHIAGAHYTNGADKIPGDATETVAAEDDDRLIYAGIDGIYNNSNDYYIADRRANVRAGKDLIWDTKDDEMWDIGSDAVHGNWNDIFLGYPNNTDAPENVGSYSGAAISGSFDTSVSPVGFGKSVNGVWSKDTFGRWSFTSEDGVKAKSKWVNIYSKALDKSDWYYFDNNGIMQSGWQKAGNSKWYFLRTVNDARFGAMEKGLIQDSSDGNYYYLDPVAGVMQTGWQKINGKYYYFAETSSGSAWFWNSQIGRWASAVLGGHPYGSMYRNEKTPDGRRVGADGARID